jgi:iron-sulfur cluster assembly protein
MAITVTEKAAKHIRGALARKGGVGLRFGVKKVGCSGLAYTFDYASEIGADDEQFRTRDVTVVVDRESLPFVDGSVLDYARDGLNESFKVENPKAKAQCGCGESFTVA